MSARLNQTQRLTLEASWPEAQFDQTRLGMVLQVQCWLLLYCSHVSYSDQECNFCNFAAAADSATLNTGGEVPFSFLIHTHDGTVGWMLLPSGDAFALRSDYEKSQDGTTEKVCYTLGWTKAVASLYNDGGKWYYSRFRGDYPRALPEPEIVHFL